MRRMLPHKASPGIGCHRAPLNIAVTAGHHYSSARRLDSGRCDQYRRARRSARAITRSCYGTTIR